MKKILLLLVSIVICFSMFGCAKQSDEPDLVNAYFDQTFSEIDFLLEGHKNVKFIYNFFVGNQNVTNTIDLLAPSLPNYWTCFVWYDDDTKEVIYFEKNADIGSYSIQHEFLQSLNIIFECATGIVGVPLGNGIYNIVEINYANLLIFDNSEDILYKIESTFPDCVIYDRTTTQPIVVFNTTEYSMKLDIFIPEQQSTNQ